MPISAENRRRALQERRIAREHHIEASLHIWEREIVPDWRVVYKNPQLRKLWWQGIPTRLRGSMWEKAVGNPLALSKGEPSVAKLYFISSWLGRPLSVMSLTREACHFQQSISSSNSRPHRTRHLLNPSLYASLSSRIWSYVYRLEGYALRLGCY